MPRPLYHHKFWLPPLAGLTACALVNAWLIHGLAEADASLSFWGRWIGSFLLLASIGCGVALVLRLKRSVADSITHLVEVAQANTHGRVRRASVDAAGPFSLLALAFNQMVDARQRAEEQLQREHDSLDLKVHARTAELFRANTALREETEQRAQAQRDFHQAQKMDALGKLAGSIAHDFNNLLTVIIGGAEYAQAQLTAEHPAVSILQTVQQAGERAAGLTRPLLTFSRNEVMASEPTNLNGAAEEASRMLTRLLGVNIQLQLELAPDLQLVQANANQLQQVIINLAVNARDAMEGSGTLTILTRNAPRPDGAPIGPEGPVTEQWVELAVRDTGCGMDATTKARIFEPFFTTKPAGRGTGLGLATVFGIVRQGGGVLEVESAPGEGSTFRVFFQATTARPEAAVHPVEEFRKAGPAAGDITVLLVDDEDDIRELASMTLESEGYRVLQASNAEEAIVLGEAHAREINVLVTDVVMPGLSGVQLAEVIAKLIPDLKVLFVSGYSNDSISTETLQATHADYLQKPYRGHALAAKVSEILAPKAAAA